MKNTRLTREPLTCIFAGCQWVEKWAENGFGSYVKDGYVCPEHAKLFGKDGRRKDYKLDNESVDKSLDLFEDKNILETNERTTGNERKTGELPRQAGNTETMEGDDEVAVGVDSQAENISGNGREIRRHHQRESAPN